MYVSAGKASGLPTYGSPLIVEFASDSAFAHASRMRTTGVMIDVISRNIERVIESVTGPFDSAVYGQYRARI